VRGGMGGRRVVGIAKFVREIIGTIRIRITCHVHHNKQTELHTQLLVNSLRLVPPSLRLINSLATAFLVSEHENMVNAL